jgi:phosphate acetyltransferase
LIAKEKAVSTTQTPNSYSEQTHQKYQRLVAAARALARVMTAVAHPCDQSSLEGAINAAEMGLINPILIGPKEKIAGVAQQFKLDISPYECLDVRHSHAAAAKAVEIVREGRAEALMKGSLHTDEVMGEVVKRNTGIRTACRISHCFVLDVPTYDEAIIVSDAAVNIAPTLEAKLDIVRMRSTLPTRSDATRCGSRSSRRWRP